VDERVGRRRKRERSRKQRSREEGCCAVTVGKIDDRSGGTAGVNARADMEKEGGGLRQES
jgi:hypothetical protein